MSVRALPSFCYSLCPADLDGLEIVLTALLDEERVDAVAHAVDIEAFLSSCNSDHAVETTPSQMRLEYEVIAGRRDVNNERKSTKRKSPSSPAPPSCAPSSYSLRKSPVKRRYE